MRLLDLEPVEMVADRVAQSQQPLVTQLHDTDRGEQLADAADAVERIAIGRALAALGDVDAAVRALAEALQIAVATGAEPRTAEAHAALAGRSHVAIEDVRAIAKPVLRHRIVTNFTAQAEGITSDHLIDRLIEEIDPSQAVGAGLPGVRDQSAS